MNFSPLELGVVLVLVFLLFGPKRLPELARSFGKAIREFKHSMSEASEEIRTAATPTAPHEDGERGEETPQK